MPELWIQVVLTWLNWFRASMDNPGLYGDGRTYALPDGWEPVGADVLAVATERTLAAVTGDMVKDRVARYYDPLGSYAGTLFSDVEPNDESAVGAADLYAVTTLSMKLDSRYGRTLLSESGMRQAVRTHLMGLPSGLSITDLDHGQGGSAETLSRMYALHSLFRDLLGGSSNKWVTAAKLCARKRPSLFPVRDSAVCRYIGGGDFAIDVQVFAYLMTQRAVGRALETLRHELEVNRKLRVDAERLRLLDSALWMAASAKS